MSDEIVLVRRLSYEHLKSDIEPMIIESGSATAEQVKSIISSPMGRALLDHFQNFNDIFKADMEPV
jgi:hypothetical protein